MSTIKLYTRTAPNSFREYRKFEPGSVIFEVARPQCVYGQLHAVNPDNASYVLENLRSVYVSKRLDANNRYNATKANSLQESLWSDELNKATMKIEECDEARVLLEVIKSIDNEYYPAFYFGYNIEKDDTDLTVEDIA